jgi:hypothetical protein
MSFRLVLCAALAAVASSLTFTTAAAQELDSLSGGAPVNPDATAPADTAVSSGQLAVPAGTTAVVAAPSTAAVGSGGGGDATAQNTPVPAATSGAVVTPPPSAALPVSTSAMAASTAASPSGHFELADRIVVRKGSRRLLLMRAGNVVAEYPVRLGLNPTGRKEREGDFRTPEGHYWLTRRNQSSDFFLSIEVSYPNDNDRSRARQLRTAPGGSIMIHGQPNFPRKPADYYVRNDWTDGCIAVSNSDMVDIWLRTRIGLPIEIRP